MESNGKLACSRVSTDFTNRRFSDQARVKVHSMVGLTLIGGWFALSRTSCFSPPSRFRCHRVFGFMPEVWPALIGRTTCVHGPTELKRRLVHPYHDAGPVIARKLADHAVIAGWCRGTCPVTPRPTRGSRSGLPGVIYCGFRIIFLGIDVSKWAGYIMRTPSNYRKRLVSFVHSVPNISGTQILVGHLGIGKIWGQGKLTPKWVLEEVSLRLPR